MAESVYLFVVPVVVSLLLVPLRKQRPLYWWLLLLVVGALVLGGILLKGRTLVAEGELLGVAVLLLAPLVAMFVVLRADLFRRRVYLIALLGPVVYLVAAALALSMLVTLGLLQP